MKTLQYLKWILVSIMLLVLVACGGSSSSDDEGVNDVKPELTISYPQDNDILVHFEQTNGNAQGDYRSENGDGEAEWLGTIDGVVFSITYIDDFPNEIVYSNSKATYSDNGDETFNYKVYIDDELLEEVYSAKLASLERLDALEVNAISRTVTRVSEEECENKKNDITLYYKLAALNAKKIKDIEFENYHECLRDSNYNYELCDKEYPDSYFSSFKDLMAEFILSDKTLAILLDDYQSSCLGTAVDDVIVEPTIQSILVSNSTSSTFRIVRLSVGITGDASPAMTTVPIGEGIHRGYNVTFDVDPEECDMDWIINASYNDIPSTSCSTTGLIKCREVNSFTFNNLSCQ